jgi:hypothetical protein|tara:strand:- start:86 stop:568 length:483 start_codon:yes stop_codon:yes gene_type:complete
MIYKGQQIKNITLNMLYDMFRSIGNSSLFIQTTTIGDIFEVDLTETTYPLLHIGTQTAGYTKNELTYSFQFIVMDLVSKDESNEEDVLSDMLQVIGDIISKLKNSDYDTNYEEFRHDIRIQDSISCEPFTERFDNEVTGWTANVSITVNFNASACSGSVA